MEHRIAHVANNIQLQGALPVQLTEGAFFRRAKMAEIEDIDYRNSLAMAATSIPIRSYRHTYDEVRKGTSTSYKPILLPESEWRYWVLDFKGDGLVFHNLEKLLTLTNPPVYLSFCRISGITSPLEGLRPLSMHVAERAEKLWWRGPREPMLDVKHLIETCSNLHVLTQQATEYKYVTEAVDKFFDLQRLPPTSDMYTLGLFSIIESLIAHKPRLNESLDSINHQLVNKLLLLEENILKNPITAKEVFGNISHPSIWKKLYAFRSQLAHTAVSTISGELQSLKSREEVTCFVEAKTKELIRLALEKPKFLLHLKAC